MRKLILVDSNALVHRAFHALPPMNSPKGLPTNAVYGFTAVFLKMLKDIKPDYIAATFDLAAPTFRHEEFEEYKAHRMKAPDELYIQVQPIKELLMAFGVPIYERAGYEADDLIGSLAEKAKKSEDLQVIIVTGDLDTLQLVDGDKVVVFTLRKGITDTITYDEKEVKKRYGFLPERVTDYKGLRGDPSDNIPGVKGVGETTATTLIKKYGTIEKLYEEIERKAKSEKRKATVKKPKEINILPEKLVEKLLADKDMAFFSKKLATIVRTVEVDFDLDKTDWRKNLNREALEKILRDLGFYSLVKRLDESLGQNPSKPEQLSVFADEAIKPAVEMVEIADPGKLPPAGELAICLGDDFASFASNPDRVYKIRLQGRKISDTILTKTRLIGHDLKYLNRRAFQENFEIKNEVFDTKIAAYLINPDGRDYDFYKVFYAELGYSADENPVLRPAYALRLRQVQWEKLKSNNLIKVFEDIEMPLIKVLAWMELNGIKVDVRVLNDLQKLCAKELAQLKKQIHILAGDEFNINSPQQLGEILFTKLALKGRVRKTGKGVPSTAAPELEKIRDEHPIIPLVLDYRELQKLKTAYIEPFPELISKKDGRIHTTYNQTGTGTGRLASQDPNLQNIPTRTELGQEFRKAFVAGKGNQLLSFDYSQIELRIVAHLAHDEKMIAAFKRGEDIHTRTASEVFGVLPEKVTKEMRRQAKVLNFGIIYGMGVLGFARSAGVDRNRAREFIDRYFREFEGVARYMAETKKLADRNEYVQTLFGRRRLLPEIHSQMPQLRAQAERMAVNHPVQGTAADLIKMAMITVDKYLQGSTLKKEKIKMLLQVHDELVFEVNSGFVAQVAPKIKEIMGGVYKLDIPLVIDVKVGENWAEMKKL